MMTKLQTLQKLKACRRKADLVEPPTSSGRRRFVEFSSYLDNGLIVGSSTPLKERV